jgi:cyclopropane-fatty-acyl-phospholipid synthase
MAETRTFLFTSIKNNLNMATETLTRALKAKTRSTKFYSAWLQNFARKQVLARLKHLQTGHLTLIENGVKHEFGIDKSIQATVTVHDAHFYGEMAFGGSIGAGEAYMLGYWQADNLTDVIRIMAANQSVMDALEGGYQWLSKPFLKALHWLNRNTTDGSRKNIAAHYDLGNDFFKLWLDPSMMYSAAIFSPLDCSLEAASNKKLQVICDKLDLQPTDYVVEIGTGWGGFAIYAAKHYGCKVTTTTISQQQYDEAKLRVNAANLQDKITLLLNDYRDLQGQFDKLVSIEMIEAVGHQFYDIYFAKCAALLKPDGMALIQAITITDQRFEAAKNSVDFIQRYIFPGSNIPSISAMLASITKSSDLKLYDLEDIGPHYATTLRIWRERFFANIDAVRSLGYSEEFIKMWEFYLCYCEGGFAERALGDVHLLLVKPENRRDAIR